MLLILVIVVFLLHFAKDCWIKSYWLMFGFFPNQNVLKDLTVCACMDTYIYTFSFPVCKAALSSNVLEKVKHVLVSFLMQTWAGAQEQKQFSTDKANCVYHVRAEECWKMCPDGKVPIPLDKKLFLFFLYSLVCFWVNGCLLFYSWIKE